MIQQSAMPPAVLNAAAAAKLAPRVNVIRHATPPPWLPQIRPWRRLPPGFGHRGDLLVKPAPQRLLPAKAPESPAPAQSSAALVTSPPVPKSFRNDEEKAAEQELLRLLTAEGMTTEKRQVVGWAEWDRQVRAKFPNMSKEAWLRIKATAGKSYPELKQPGKKRQLTCPQQDEEAG
jgi:hypothetical protein